MNRCLTLCALVAFGCSSSAALAAPPPEGLVGAWRGTLENFPAQEDHRRDLIISADGSCKWGFADKAGKAECAYGANNTVTVKTNAKRPSKVELTLASDKLSGAFTLYQDSRFYTLTMSKLQPK